MVFTVLVFLFTAKIVFASDVQCISNCTISDLNFNDKFSLPDGQCEQRISGSDCTVRVNFNYHERRYTVEFGKSHSSADFIYVSSQPYLSYTINNFCSDQTDCVFKDLQKNIDNMVQRTYNAKDIYEQFLPLIKDSSREDSPVKCYDMRNEIVECSEKEICGLSYDQKDKKIRARGCDIADEPRVLVYDADYFSALHINCNRDLCNDETTLTTVQTILSKNGLTDADGRRVVIISNGIQKFISIPLFTFTFIFSFISFF